MSPRHPSDYQLEAYLLKGERSPVAAHVADCAACAARVDSMRHEGTAFDERILPRLRPALAGQRPAPRTRRLRWLLAIPAFAGVGLAVLLHNADGPVAGVDPFTHTKGEGCGLVVYVNHAGTGVPATEGEAIPAAASLRFRFLGASPMWLSLMSVDQFGEVSRLFPGDAESARVSGGTLLPGGAVLDGKAGPERLFLFCGRERLREDELQQAVVRSIASNADAVRRVTTIERLREEVDQGSILLEKR